MAVGAGPLFEAQEGLWYAQALDRTNPIFNAGQYVALSGPLDLAAFCAAFDAAVAQTPALALRFGTQDGRPVQWRAEAPVLAVVDLSTAADPEAEARARMAADSAHPVDLAGAPVAAFALFILGPERHFWYERIHHLAADGYAFVLFTNRVGEIYSARVEERAAPAAFPPLEQAVEEDANWRAAPRRLEERDFWREEMRGLDVVAGPAEGRAVTAHRFDRARCDLDADLCAALRARAKAAGVGWPDVVTVLTAAYLDRVSGEGERVFGLPFMGRMGTKVARVPCMWMNVLPWRFTPDEDAPLDEVLRAEAARLAGLRRNGRYRSEQLRRDLRRTAIDARLHGPLINVQPFDLPPRFSGLDVELHILGAGAVDDLTATYRGDPAKGLSLEIDTNPLLYTAASGAAHLRRLAAFLRAALAAGRLADVPTTDAEDEAWRARINDTAHPLPEITLAALIEAQMARSPDAPAVQFGDTVLSYAELDRRSAALAAALRARGAGPGGVVAVALARSEHLAVALVAVLRAGAAYVPLDPDNPPARLAALIARTGACALLAEAALDVGSDTGILPFAPAEWPATGPAPETGAGPDDLAYILFTSGSTGEPKGVMIEHRAIVNRLLWMREHYGFGPADRILQKTPTTFDVSVWELFLPYLCGGTLVFAPPGAHRDPSAIAALIRDRAITTLHFVPSMLSAFLDAPASDGLVLGRVFCSGEALGAVHRARFHARVTAELHNLYGPTEAAVDVTYWPAGPRDTSDPMPIGYPVWNTGVHVLDARMRPVPAGVRGGLWLGGVQLARGYLGRADLTAERFVETEHGRLYATGDVAMLRPDGAVVYLGRADHQVKIRGMRIEPGEIEAAIRDTGLVRDVVVIARADGGDARLVAYVLADPDFVPAQLLAEIAGRLPAHMVPAAVVALREWPMTVSGKLDRKALPAPVFAVPAGAPPEGPVETRLAALFAEVLHLPSAPGREADFFALGGDSLSAVTLTLRLDEVFGQDPGLGQLFETPSIAGLARAMALQGEARAGLAPLLALSGGAEEPLFALHPAGGLGWCYRRLARAMPGHPLIALQSPLLAGGDFPESLGALAADYAARIVAARPEGRIHLAGWSVGGILAQEIAVTLRQAGREVGQVALLDAYPADCWRSEPEPDTVAALRALIAIAGYDPDAHPELSSREAVVGFLRQGGTALGSLPGPVLDAVVRLVTGTNRLIRAHRHRAYDGGLLHVRAARDHAGRDFAAGLWAPYAARIEAVDLPMLHAEMVSQPAAERLGPLFSARMRG